MKLFVTAALLTLSAAAFSHFAFADGPITVNPINGNICNDTVCCAPGPTGKCWPKSSPPVEK